MIRAADDYELGPESLARGEKVPAGRVEAFDFNESKIFEGTARACWVYIPAQYDGTKPAALMVFQDGHSYVATNGSLRAPLVMDNLIAQGDMPVTVGIFVNPGHKGSDGPPAGGWGNRSNRSLEYDGLGDAYAKFLVEELIPYVTKRWDLKLSEDPSRWAIAGQSSGGICAWTAAWEHPERFGRVLSHIGSFVNIRGGHVYPALLRKTPRKAVRVFLQDGSNDLNNEHGNWPLANQQMAASLAFVGYDFRFEFGDGAHNAKHGGAILPDSLRWLWRTAMDPATPTYVDGTPEFAGTGILGVGGGGLRVH
jgi:enterochelin esterase-like enzyme